MGFTASENNQTITLYDEEEQLNIIASDGCAKILDITEESVSDRIDVSNDNDSFLNGSFTIYPCL